MSVQEREDSASATHLDQSFDAPPARPGGWRRVATGAIATLYTVLGAVLLIASLREASQEAECRSSGGWFCDLWILVLFLAAYLLVIAVVFGIATFLPFGRPRRFAVALGVGLVVAPVAGWLLSIILHPVGFPVGFPVAFLAGFYIGYRLSR